MALQMHSNLLAVYPQILDRMANVPGVAAVKEVGELAELLAAQREKRKVSPLDGAVYVVYSGSSPDGQAAKGKAQKERLDFTFVLCRRYTANGKSTLHAVGQTLTAIQAAFQGWDAGAEYTATPFVRSASPAIEYNDGFAFYPISFTTTVAMMAA